jgi:predicted ArsR family transcriptional regulator
MVDQPEPNTRRSVLEFLKVRGASKVKPIADACGLTAMAVRKHLLSLQADDLVQSRTERQAQGRPAKVYSLTDRGDAKFTRDYGGLIVELLSSLQALDGADKIASVFRKRREELTARFVRRLRDLDFEGRVRETAAILSEYGYMAEARSSGAKQFVIIEHNCAIRDVAQRHPVACQEELCFIGRLCGGSVKRLSHLLCGDAFCSYSVEAKPVVKQQRHP